MITITFALIFFSSYTIEMINFPLLLSVVGLNGSRSGFFVSSNGRDVWGFYFPLFPYFRFSLLFSVTALSSSSAPRFPKGKGNKMEKIGHALSHTDNIQNKEARRLIETDETM